MITTMYKRGFTLIELLVVIAIIGILASVILVSLNSARGGGSDANIKANLNAIRIQAELEYDTSVAQNYANVCANATVVAAMDSARGQSPATSWGRDVAGTATVGACNDTANDWAAQMPLKTSGFWCVDSNGVSKSSASSMLTTTTDIDC